MIFLKKSPKRIKKKTKRLKKYYLFLSMYDEGLADRIRNYGRLSYSNGYKDGYLIGLITGSFIGIFGVFAVKTLCSRV